jgi:hypothetical protein
MPEPRSNRLIPRLAPPALAALLTGSLAIRMNSFAGGDRERAAPFHEHVRQAVEAIPFQIGTWEGVDSKIPEAAGQLLRPNALFARAYRDTTNGEWAKVVVVHCKDTRDMSGHFPPNCYPGNGWTQVSGPILQTLHIWDRDVPIAEYRFTLQEVRGTLDWCIYDFFVLPTAGFVTSMNQIQKASGDYRTRPYGAAQVQVIMDASLSSQDRERILRTMLDPLRPVIEQLQLNPEGARP